jgi:hypothetical protein
VESVRRLAADGSFCFLLAYDRLGERLSFLETECSIVNL